MFNNNNKKRKKQGSDFKHNGLIKLREKNMQKCIKKKVEKIKLW